ncbi:MAG: hypothetical protein ABL997_05655 [Planctomycetota bacterium]
MLGAAAVCPLLPSQTAAFSTYGTGCYSQRASFFESFPSNTFDLSGTTANPFGYSMINIGQGWLVLPLLSGWHTPSASAQVISLADDAVSSALAFGFTMPFPGGTTDSVWASSNGFCYLAADTSNGCCSGDPAQMLSGAPRIAGVWMDLNPSASGQVTIDRDTANGGMAYLTYNGVPEYGASGTVTFQVAFYSFGQIDVLYGPCSNTGHTALAGWSPGRGVASPGAMNLSQMLQNILITGPDSDPLRLSSTGRPRLGTTIPIAVSNVPNTSPFVWIALGSTQYFNGVDLSPIGMFDCLQYASIENAFGATTIGSTATWQCSVPNNSSLIGQRAYLQAMAMAPDRNGLGLIVSNAADLLVGTL